jgi:translation elongation factor EF-Ts
MVGRIESYLHSDKSTPNKGGAMVKVLSDTDFGAKTPEFIEFSQLVAKRSFAAQAESWDEVKNAFPEVEDERILLEKALREKIVVDKILILVL